LPTPPIAAEISSKIYELGQQIPRLSNREIAAKLAVHHTTVLRYRDQKPDDRVRSQPKDRPGAVSESHEVAGDTWTVSIPKTRICTLDELVEHCKIDLAQWDVERFICNKWEVGIKVGEPKSAHIVTAPLFQVKAFLRKRRHETSEGYIEENIRLRSQVAKMQISLGKEKVMSKRLAQNHAGYDDLIENMRSLKESLGDFRLRPSMISPAAARIKAAVKPGHTEDAVLLLSDTHFGEKHRREDVSGFQVCDSVILANRMGSVIASAKEVLSIQRAAYPIKKLYVWIGGDIGNGELHDSAKSNDLMITEQVHFAYYMLKFGIEDLLTLTIPDKKTGLVVVEEIVLLFTVGNHMRMDEKMPHDLQARRTFDWLIYQFLIEQFSRHPKVTIRKEMSPFIFETIRGWRHLFCHGMQIGYKNSPDAQAKSISQFMALARALFDSPQWRQENGLQGETFARACGGDIHVPVSFPRYKGNGSLPGQNSLGVNWQLEPIPAGQQIFGVTESRLETWSYFLEVTKVQRSEADMNDYGRFAKEYLERGSK
jgi:hypothetical protein